MLTSSPDVDDGKAFERSLDFPSLPNIQEVDFSFRVDWMGGGLPWIPMALSTLKPATSPRLSAIQLNFVWQSSAYQSVETAIEGAGDDLRRIADEVIRIKREFEGAAILTVAWDSGFKAVLDKLNVSFHPCGLKLIHFIHPSQILQCRAR